MIDFEKLFQEYAADGHSTDNTLRYLKKTASHCGVSEEAVTLAMQQTFAEMSQGKKFSKTKCRCGCEIDKAATDLIHYIRDRMFRINKRMNDAKMAEINKTFNKAVSEAKRSRLTNWNKSPVLRMFGYNKVK